MKRLTADECGAVVFDILAECAVRGERCPCNIRYKDSDPPALVKLFQERTGVTHVLPPGLLTDMVDKGFIRIEVSGQNWRVIEICQGEHKGRRTQEHPQGLRPWRVFAQRKAAGS